jgi:hypothetical protein
MQKAQTLVTSRPEIGACALILLGAFVSFVLSVVLRFGVGGGWHRRLREGAALEGPADWSGTTRGR